MSATTVSTVRQLHLYNTVSCVQKNEIQRTLRLTHVHPLQARTPQQKLAQYKKIFVYKEIQRNVQHIHYTTRQN